MKGFTKRRFAAWLVLLILAGAFFFSFIHLFTRENDQAKVYELNTNWNLSRNGEMHTGVDVSDFEIKNVKAGEVIELSQILPDNFKAHKTMFFITYLSTVDAWVDGQLVYSYGHEIAERGDLVGSGYHVIELPDNSSGKQIVIRVIPREPDAFTCFESIRYGTMRDLNFTYIQEHIVTVIICIFLIVLGAVMTVLSVFSIAWGDNFAKFIPVCIFSFIMGLYGLCSIKFLEIIGYSLWSNTICEYITLYFAPTPVALIFATIRKNDKWIERMIYISAGIFFTAASGSIVLNAHNLVHFPRLLRMFHFSAVVMIAEATLIVVHNIRNHIKANSYMTNGFIALCTSALIDLIRFNVQKYMMPNSDHIGFSFLPIGALLFIVLLLVNNMVNVFRIEVEETEKRILAKLAYTDSLCQIYNRTKCQEEFEHLDRHHKEYAMINFDLNGLKVTNDKQGHAKGDILLRRFAKVLTESFQDVGQVYRMGGDEFLVIVRKSQFDNIEDALLTMRRLEKQCSEEIEMELDASYGIAYSSDLTNATTDKVYSLADQRMYEMKNAHYQNS